MAAGTSQLREILEAHEQARERIALDIHDNVLQTLTSALHHILAADQAAQNREERRHNLLRAVHLVRQSIYAARGLMGELKPPVLDRLGLVETLRYDLHQLEEETNWQIHFQADVVTIPWDLELPLYHILREAITNARKHSSSRTLRVRLHLQPQPLEVVAEVEDRGRGFDPSAVPRGRLGLLSMRTRAKTLGGECQIQSAVGQGTTVLVRLPLREGLGANP